MAKRIWNSRQKSGRQRRSITVGQVKAVDRLAPPVPSVAVGPGRQQPGGHLPRHIGGIARLEKQPGHPIAHGIRHSPDPAGDNRDAAGHRLGRRDAQPVLCDRWDLCVAKLTDGRISIPEQRLRGGCRTDRTASDDANGPEKEVTRYFWSPPTGRDIPHR